MAEKKVKVITDVAHPDKTAPSMSSKPIIVTNRPLMKDPMVVEETPAEATEEPVAASSATRIKITPLSPNLNTDDKSGVSDDTKEPDAAEPAAQAAASDEPEVATGAPDTSEASDAQPEPEPAATPEEPAITPEATDASGETPEGDVDGAMKKADTEAERKAAERIEELNKLAADKTYFLPINQRAHRRAHRMLVLTILVLVVLAIVWVDLALDAGLITIHGVHAPTNFFQ